jgi:transcriptional regulator GlxA family with amidase domain
VKAATSPENEPIMNRKRVGILLFPNIEVLDFAGPYEVFTVVRLNEDKRREEVSPFDVKLIAATAHPVTTSAGMRVIPDCTIDDAPPLDVLVVPGGWGVRTEIANEWLIHWIRETSKQAETVAAVCTGSMLLGQAGVLDRHRATTHWRSIDWMRESFPTVQVEQDQHVVEDGKILTSAGISAGIDLALRIVARYLGERKALETAHHMEYAYPTDNQRRVST